MASKPEFILVPGAWHGPESFGPTTTLLVKAGYTVHGIPLASSRGPPHIETFDPDVKLIKSTLEDVLSSGKDVIMLYHSYGGVPGSEALAPYLTPRPKPGYGKILRLVYIAAFVLPVGGSLIAALQNKPLPWFIVSKDGELVEPDQPEEIFYNDLEPAVAGPLIEKLKPHAYRTFWSEMTVAPWKEVKATYVMCSLDNAIPLPVQELMVGMARDLAPGSFDVVERLEASHSPFISKPKELAEILLRAAESV